jgi:chromosome segregation ATPase
MIQKNGEIIAEMTKISEENQYVAERFKSAQIEINDLSESLNAVNNVLVMEKQKLQMTIEQKEEFSAKLKQIETEKATLAENVKSSEQKNVKYETIITELERQTSPRK